MSQIYKRFTVPGKVQSLSAPLFGVKRYLNSRLIVFQNYIYQVRFHVILKTTY